jgi:proteic killer suppression protein
VIQTYRDRDTRDVAERRPVRKLARHIQRQAQRKLMMINNAKDVNELRIPPGNRLERLKGDRRNIYSIRINQQWRICFDWHDGDAYDVEIVDYH